ncbi:MAG: amino acid permease [Fervidicoccaceae archaeon]
MVEGIESIRKKIEEREGGLLRALNHGQMVMMSIGSAIGTGMFLGSGFAIKLAGPGVAISFVIGAIIAYTVGLSLAEMTKIAPSTGSFGNHAEIFIGRYMGFLVRYMYWFAEVFAIGADLVAASIYMSYWFPEINPVVWMLVYGIALFILNSATVKAVGTVEFILSFVKSSAIVLFIIIGSYIILRPTSFGISYPDATYTSLLPNGLLGVWLATVVAIYSFIGVEVAGVTSGEAKNPEKDAPKALKTTLALLTFLYVVSMVVIVNIVPWSKSGVGESPFVAAFQLAGIPAAASITNFIILTAALSGANTDLYLSSRMLFSLSRGRLAPTKLGKLNRFKVPFNAVLASMFGVAVMTFASYRYGSSASYLIAFGIAAFGGIFVWLSILVSHIAFSLRYKKMTLPLLSGAGTVLLFGVLISTAITPGIEITIPSGISVISVLTLLYFIRYKEPADESKIGKSKLEKMLIPLKKYVKTEKEKG